MTKQEELETRTRETLRYFLQEERIGFQGVINKKFRSGTPPSSFSCLYGPDEYAHYNIKGFILSQRDNSRILAVVEIHDTKGRFNSLKDIIYILDDLEYFPSDQWDKPIHKGDLLEKHAEGWRVK